MRVEAVRQALFSKADKNADGGSPEKLGNGILQAAAALTLQPPAGGLAAQDRARQRRVSVAARVDRAGRRAGAGR